MDTSGALALERIAVSASNVAVMAQQANHQAIGLRDAASDVAVAAWAKLLKKIKEED